MPWSQSTDGHFWEILCSLLQGPGTFSKKQNQRKKKEEKKRIKLPETQTKAKQNHRGLPFLIAVALTAHPYLDFSSFHLFLSPWFLNPAFSFLRSPHKQSVSTQVLFCEVSRLAVNPWLAVRFLRVCVCVCVWDLCLEWHVKITCEYLWISKYILNSFIFQCSGVFIVLP